jgi:hypothetical protein
VRQRCFQLGNPLAAGLYRLQLRAHVLAKRRQLIRLDAVLAGKRADVEQPRLRGIEPRGVERQGVGRAGDSVLGLGRFDHRPVERRQCLGKQRMIRGAALDPPGGQPQLGQRAFRPAKQFVETGQRFAGLHARLHRGPFLGEPRLLAGLRVQRRDFGHGMVQIVAVAVGAFRRGLRLGQFIA